MHKTCLLVLLCIVAGPISGQPVYYNLSPFEIGRYDAAGNPIGLWNYFDEPDSLGLTINYDTRSLIYLKGKSPQQSCISTPNGWKTHPVRRPARFIGSYFELYRYYLREASTELNYLFRNNPLYNNISNKIIFLSFEVDEDGLAKKPEVNGEYDRKISSILLDAFKGAPNRWLPAIKENQESATKFTIPFFYCVDTCKEVSALKPGKITDHGQILFSVPIGNSVKSPSNLTGLYLTNPYYFILGWSSDEQNILIHRVADLISENKKTFFGITLPTIFQQVSLNGQLTSSYLLKNGGGIICYSSDCSDFIVQFSGWHHPLLALYNSKFHNLNYIKCFTPFSPALLPGQSMAAIGVPAKNGSELLLWDIQRNILNSTPIKSNLFIQPIIWVDENNLLVWESNIADDIHYLTLVNIRTGDKQMLPFINAHFQSISPNHKEILIKKTDRFGKTKLFIYNLETGSELELLKSFNPNSTAFFGRSENEIIYVANSALLIMDVRTKKSKKIITNVAFPALSPKGNKLLYFEEKSKSIYIYDFNTGTKTKICPLPTSFAINLR
jgi:hypothetical protein